MNLLECIDFYLQKGYEDAYAISKVAQDIILSKIAKSNYRNNITIKGGVVMFNITNDKRRATVDIDIDLIRYSLEDNSILLLFNKLNEIEDGVKIMVNKKIKPLKHHDYHGKRVSIILKDSFQNQIETKIDIGVHKNLDIKQEEYVFNFEVFNNSMSLLINTKEQIFVEKLSSMLKHSIRTTRYKDVHDFYYLITEGNMDKHLLIELIDLYCARKSIEEIQKELSKIFRNINFIENAKNSRYNWVEEEINIVLDTILEYIEELEYIIEKNEDEYDLECYKKAKEEYEKNPKEYLLGEVKEELHSDNFNSV